MSVLFDMLTALIAALISAALLHFGGAQEAEPHDPPVIDQAQPGPNAPSPSVEPERKTAPDTE